MARDLVELVLRHDGQEVERARTNVDVERGDELLKHMVAALKRAEVFSGVLAGVRSAD